MYIKRERYLSKIRPFYDVDLIKVLTGVRRCGKSILLEQIKEEFIENGFDRAHIITINFEDLQFEKIRTAEKLNSYVNEQIKDHDKYLIFLDEIQECPNARCAIKFLVEDGRFDYIESGSLLGVRYKEVPSYAVGYEEICYMYPMDFEEYIRANGVQDSTIELLKTCYSEQSEVPEVVHQTMLKLFYTYIVVGGMPAVVQIYVNTHDIGKVVALQREILELYRLDIGKYAEGSDKIKIRAIFDSIPAQLNEKNRRFKLNSINASARHIRYEDSFNWLADAGVALPCYNVTEPQAPLQLSEKRNLFKLYMNDVGLLCASCMENIQFDLLMGNVDVNMGSILENAFAQNLKSNGFELHYYDSKKIGELDFVLQKGLHTELVEIKSGNDFKKHLAMDHAMKVEQWKFEKNIVFSKSNVEEDGEILYLPWYMILFYKQEREPEKMIYEIDLSGLV